MSAVIRSEFTLALNQVATERGIDPAVVLETIKAAILAAYRKDYGDKDLEQLDVIINPNTGEARVLKDKKDITPPGFGRIATQTAKQVILQRIREAEKKAVISEYSQRIGTVTSGMVLRFDGPNVIVDIGRTEAVMPPSEQIITEHYRLNQRLAFYLEGIKETLRGSQIIVSRAHKELIAGLFFREVPEVANAAVQIKEIAREAGFRTKIAVTSNQSGVDPVGSCVGQKGVRVQAVINELGGTEKIDIIQWNEDPKTYIIAALSPTQDVEIVLNEKKKSAEAFVPDDQLSLAIGRDGQNVRLASKLSGWKINIKPKSVKTKTVIIKSKKTEKKEKVVPEKDKPSKVKIKKSREPKEKK